MSLRSHSPFGLNLGDGRAHGLSYRADLFWVLVLVSRPEEAPEPIVAAARHHVKVQVRDALTDAIVGGNESSFGVHGLLHGFGQKLDAGEKRREQHARQI